jgi:hypothetical protein
MASKADGDLDAALGALAQELGAAGPRPGPALTAGVLADAAVTAFARDVNAAAPRPTPELVARVLADAAAVAAECPTPPAAARSGAGARTATRRRSGLAEWIFGWTGGAVAAMALGLAVGLGLGLEAGPGTLPLLDSVDADPFAIAEAEPILFAEGL